MRYLYSALCLLILLTQIKAQIFVDIDAAGNNNGTSWANAFNVLQEAIDSAMVDDSIWVATGIYLPTVEVDADNSSGTDPREKTFHISQDIKLFGGFAGDEMQFSERDLAANPTILSGDIGIPGDRTDNTYHIIYIEGSSDISNNCLLDGFKIVNGNADGVEENRDGVRFTT